MEPYLKKENLFWAFCTRFFNTYSLSVETDQRILPGCCYSYAGEIDPLLELGFVGYRSVLDTLAGRRQETYLCRVHFYGKVEELSWVTAASHMKILWVVDPSFVLHRAATYSVLRWLRRLGIKNPACYRMVREYAEAVSYMYRYHTEGPSITQFVGGFEQELDKELSALDTRYYTCQLILKDYGWLLPATRGGYASFYKTGCQYVYGGYEGPGEEVWLELLLSSMLNREDRLGEKRITRLAKEVRV